MQSQALYNYRYFLPYAPQWGDQALCRQRLRELLTFCRRARIDAVQFFVNTRFGTYYMPPASAEEQRAWATWMGEEVAPALRRAGISYQLNFQMLLGATSCRQDMRAEYDWEFLKDQHGEEALGCACPLSPRFRETMGAMLRLWSEGKPDVMWIDDDFRMHNHGIAKDGLDFYCYCDRHLAAFAQRCGRRYSRVDLVKRVLAPGRPSALRQEWLDFLGETMTESAAWIRREVQGVSPATRLAMMTSAPDVHSVEGRDWRAFLTALSGKHRPMTRPCSGCYTGTIVAPKVQTVTYRFMAQSIQTLEQTLGSGRVEYAPELENTRFTTWSKSSANSEYVLMLGQLLGCPQITMSLHDLDGSPIREEPTLEPLLRRNKPRLQAIAELGLRDWQPAGVALINDPRSARKVQVAGKAKMQDLGLTRDWDDILLQMGIPAYYASPGEAATTRDVVVMERATAWCLTDRQVRQVLAGAVLLDGGAAQVLQERGFGRWLGVKVGGMAGYGAMAEQYESGVLPGLDAGRVPHRAMQWHLMETTDATVCSRFIDSRDCWHVGSAVYENTLGGRVAVNASVGDLAYGTFGSHARLRWLHGLLRWLSRERFAALPVIPHHGLTVVRSEGRRTLLAFANLGTDPLTVLRVRLGRRSVRPRVKLLDGRGQWNAASTQWQGDTLRVRCRLNVFNWLVLMLEPA